MPDRLRRIDVEREILRVINDGLPEAVPLQGLGRGAVEAWSLKNGSIGRQTLGAIQARIGELSRLISSVFDESGQAIFERLVGCESEIDRLILELRRDVAG